MGTGTCLLYRSRFKMVYERHADLAIDQLFAVLVLWFALMPVAKPYGEEQAIDVKPFSMLVESASTGQLNRRVCAEKRRCYGLVHNQ